jgi:hypothetical protein
LYRKIQQDATVYQNLLFHVYMKLNMFWVTQCPSLGAEGVAEANNIQILECFITILSHTIQDLAKGAFSSGMTAGVSVFVQKSGTLG